MREPSGGPVATVSDDVDFEIPQTRRNIAGAIRNALIDDGLLDALRGEDARPISFRYEGSGRAGSGTLEYPRNHVGPVGWTGLGEAPADLPQVEAYFDDGQNGWPVKIVFQADRPSPAANPYLALLVCTSAAAFLAVGELGGYTHTTEPFPLGAEERNGYADVGVVEADGLPQCAVLVASTGGAEYIADIAVVVGNPYVNPFPHVDFRDLYNEATRK